MIALSECSNEYANANLEVHEINKVPVRHISWKDFALLAQRVRPESSNAEKHILDELMTYLGGMITMQNIDSNWVYVVSLSNRQEEDWLLS